MLKLVSCVRHALFLYDNDGGHGDDNNIKMMIMVMVMVMVMVISAWKKLIFNPNCYIFHNSLSLLIIRLHNTVVDESVAKCIWEQNVYFMWKVPSIAFSFSLNVHDAIFKMLPLLCLNLCNNGSTWHIEWWYRKLVCIYGMEMMNHQY